ncbi:MAG: arylesterase [Leptothrix sp. (in: b-proteobacteria)]
MTRRDCIASALNAAAWLALPGCSRGATPPPAGATRQLVVMGDSLSAEYGLKRGSGWVALLQARLATTRPPVEVINASISGDTTAGGLARLPEVLKAHHPSHLLIELGANDALRGLPLAATEANLRAMVGAARAAGAHVMLIGMQVPPNYGPQYTRDFSALYERVARVEKAALVPFLLKGIADDPDALRWFQADRIHPNEAAHPRLLDNVWAVLKPWLPA